MLLFCRAFSYIVHTLFVLQCFFFQVFFCWILFLLMHVFLYVPFHFFSVSEKDIPGCLSVCCRSHNYNCHRRTCQDPDRKFRQANHSGSSQLVTFFWPVTQCFPETRPPFQKKTCFIILSLHCVTKRHYPTKKSRTIRPGDPKCE